MPAAAINDMSQVLADPQLAARGMWHPLVDRDGDTVLTVGTPFRMDGEKPVLEGRWPRLGEHTADVRAAWLGSPQGGGRPALAPPAAADDGASLSAAARS